MNEEYKKIKILDACSTILSDWSCELPELNVSVEEIKERIVTALDLLQSLKGYLLAGFPVTVELEVEKWNRLMENCHLDEDTRATILDAVELANKYLSN